MQLHLETKIRFLNCIANNQTHKRIFYSKIQCRNFQFLKKSKEISIVFGTACNTKGIATTRTNTHLGDKFHSRRRPLCGYVTRFDAQHLTTEYKTCNVLRQSWMSKILYFFVVATPAPPSGGSWTGRKRGTRERLMTSCQQGFLHQYDLRALHGARWLLHKRSVGQACLVVSSAPALTKAP